MWEFRRGGAAFTDQAGIANVESQYLKATALCVVLHPEKNLVLPRWGVRWEGGNGGVGVREWGQLFSEREVASYTPGMGEGA